MEVGPLARTLIAYTRKTNSTLNSLVDGVLSTLGATPDALISTMGRHAARALEAKMLVDRIEGWLDEIDLDGPVHTKYSIPEESKGKGLTEGPRGSLGHWIKIDNYRISNYQAIVPTTWNGSPRDDNGNPGPFEQALIGTPVADIKNPIEPARVIRSFDPCLACAIHAVDVKNNKTYEIKI